MIIKTLFIVAIASVLVVCLFSFWGFVSAIFPIRLHSPATPKQFNVAYEKVTFVTADQVRLRGWFIPSMKPHAKTIILLHGYGADKGDLLASRLFLHREYNLLLFDFRYFGESEGRYSTAGLNEINDVKAAINYLHSRGIDEVGVWGISMGAAVALMAAGQLSAIKAVVAESSYAQLDMMANYYFRIPYIRYLLGSLMRLWGYVFLGYDVRDASPVSVAAKLTIPVLLIYSDSDELIPHEQSQLLKEALSQNTHAEFIELKGRLHGQTEAHVQQKISQFFAESL